MKENNIIHSASKELILSDEIPFKSCHASNIVVLPDGSIFSVWFAGSEEGADDVKIWGAKRRNGIWGSPQIITRDEEIPHWNPVLFVEQDGTVVLFYKKGREIASWQTWITESKDCCENWSKPKELVPNDFGGRGPVRNKVIRLSNNRWIAPASVENGEWRCFADYSDDNGVTWHKGNEIFADLKDEHTVSPEFRNIPVSEQSYSGRGVIQPTLWESEAGKVHMLMRSSEGFIYKSDSEDYGSTWCEGYKTVLPNNNSGIDLTKIPDGRIFLVYNPVGVNWGPRYPLELAVSDDNAKTWRNILTLEEKPGEYSYPAVICRDNSLLITYTYKRQNIAFWKVDIK